MLDPGQDAPARDALAQEARGQIEASGTLKHENTWGLRKLAFEIEQRTEADYRWFRFEASTELLEQLDHNLKIADGVLRFRVFKVDPAAPVIVPPAAGSAAASRDRADDSDAPEAVVEERQDAPAPAAVAATPLETAPESAPDVPAEAPADDSADAAE